MPPHEHNTHFSAELERLAALKKEKKIEDKAELERILEAAINKVDDYHDLVDAQKDELKEAVILIDGVKASFVNIKSSIDTAAIPVLDRAARQLANILIKLLRRVDKLQQQIDKERIFVVYAAMQKEQALIGADIGSLEDTNSLVLDYLVLSKRIEAKKNEELSVDEHVVAAQNFLPLLIHLRENIAVAVAALSSGTPDAAKSASDPSGGEKETAPTKYIYDKDLGNIREVAEGEEVKGTRVFVEATSPIHPSGTPVWVRSKPSGRGRIKPWMPAIFSKELQVEGTKDKKGRYFVFTNRSEDAPFLPPEHAQNTKPVSGWEVVTDEPEKKDIASSYERVIDPPIPSIILGVSESVYVVGERVYTFDNGHQTSAVRLSLNPDGSNPLNGKSLRGFADAAGFDKNKNIRIGSQNTRAYLDDQYVLGHVSRFEETPPEGFTPGDVVYVRVRDNQYSAVSVREVVKTSEGKSAIIIQSRPEDEEPGRKHLTHASDLRIPFVIGETAFSEKPKDGKWILLKREALDDSILVRSAEKGKGFEVGQAKHRDTTEFYASNNDTFIESSRISYVPDGVKKLSYAGESFVHLGAQLVDTGVYANGAEILVGDIVKVPNTGIIGDIVMGISGPKESEYDVKQIAQLEDGTFKIFVHAQYTPAKDADPIDVYTFIVVDDQVKTDKSAVSSIPVSLSPDDAAKKAAEAVAMSEAFEKFFTTFEEAKNVLEAKDLGVEFPELVNIDSIKLLPRTVVARYDIALSKVEEVAEAFRAVDADSSILVMHEPPTPLNDAFKGNNAIGYASGTLFINVSEPDWFSSLETHGNGKDLPFSLSSSVDTADTDEFDVIIPGSSDADKTDEFDVITNEQMAIRKIFHKFRALEAQNIGLAFRQFTTFEDGLDLGLTGMKKYETALPTLERFARAYAAVDSLSNIDVYHEGVKDKLHNVATAFVGNDTVSYDPVQHDVAINIDDPDWYLQFEGPLKVELPFDSSVSKVVEPLFPPPPSPLFPPLSSSSPEALPVNLEVSPDLPVGRPLDMSPNEIATIFGNDVLEKALQSFYDHNYDPKKIEESLLGLLANDTMLANIDMIIEERRNRKEGYHHTAEMVLKNLKEVMIPRIVHAVIQIESDKERELVFKDSRYQLQGNEGLSLKEKIARAWKDNKLAIIGGGIAALVGGAVAGPVAAGVTGGFIGKGLSRIERNDRYQTVLKDVRQNRMAAISATGMRDMAQYISYFTSTDYVASVKENTEDYGHDAVEFYYDQIQTLHREAYDATSRGESVDVINEQITTAKLRSLHAVLRERNAERLSIEDADKGPFSFLLPNQRLQDFGLGSHSAKKRAIGYAAELSVGAVVGSVVGIAGAASFLKVAGRFGIGAVTGSLEHYVQADAVGKRETEVLIAEYVQRLHTELSDYRDTALSSGSLDLSVYTTNIDRLHTAYERLTHIRAAGIISPDKEEFGLIESWIESLESIITSIGDKQLHTLLSNLDDLTYKESINTTSVLSTLHNEAWDKINSSSEGDVAHTLAKDDISRIRDAMENKKVSRMKKALWSGFKRGAFTAALGELFDGIRGRSFFAESIGLQGSSLPVSSGSDSGSLPPENVVSEKPSGFGSRATDIHGALTLGENGEPDLTVEADAQEKVAVVEPTPEADAQEQGEPKARLKLNIQEPGEPVPTPEAGAQEKVDVAEVSPHTVEATPATGAWGELLRGQNNDKGIKAFKSFVDDFSGKGGTEHALSKDELEQLVDHAKLRKGEGPISPWMRQMRFLSEHAETTEQKEFLDQQFGKTGRYANQDMDTFIRRESTRMAIREDYVGYENRVNPDTGQTERIPVIKKYPLAYDTDQFYLLNASGKDLGSAYSIEDAAAAKGVEEVELSRPKTLAELRGTSRVVEQSSVVVPEENKNIPTSSLGKQVGETIEQVQKVVENVEPVGPSVDDLARQARIDQGIRTLAQSDRYLDMQLILRGKGIPDSDHRAVLGAYITAHPELSGDTLVEGAEVYVVQGNANALRLQGDIPTVQDSFPPRGGRASIDDGFQARGGRTPIDDGFQEGSDQNVLEGDQPVRADRTRPYVVGKPDSLGMREVSYWHAVDGEAKTAYILDDVKPEVIEGGEKVRLKVGDVPSEGVIRQRNIGGRLVDVFETPGINGVDVYRIEDINNPGTPDPVTSDK